MDLTWCDDDLGWAAILRERLASAGTAADASHAADRPRLTLGDIEVARHALPGSGRSLAAPERTMLAMIEHGRALSAFPFVETLILPAQLLADSPAFASQVGLLAGGLVDIAVAWQEPDTIENFALRSDPCAGCWRITGRKVIVVGGPGACRFVVSARAGNTAQLFLLEAASTGLSVKPYMTIDGRFAADVVFDDVRVGPECLIACGDAAEVLLARALDVATAVTCAHAVGLMRFLIDATARFLTGRRQFGQALSSFQVLQHRMVDMSLHVELAESASLRAMLSLDLAPNRRALAVSAAKITTGEAARFVGQNAIQLHGGQGMRDATVATRYFRRLTAIDLSFGGAQHHLARVSDLASVT